MEEVGVLNKRARDSPEEPDSDIDSPAVKMLKESLLDILDDDPELLCSSNQDLDSFMKSFEDEITAAPEAAATVGGLPETNVVSLTSDSGESMTDLGYLLEASDDELGIPPPATSPGGLEDELRPELVRVDSESSELGDEFWGNPCYDSFGEMGNDEVALDGFLDCYDVGFGSADISRRPKSMPAQ